jgi:hypothetical protein
LRDTNPEYGLLNIDAAGIVLVDHKGTLGLVAASAEQTRLLELFYVTAVRSPSPTSQLSAMAQTRPRRREAALI